MRYLIQDPEPIVLGQAVHPESPFYVVRSPIEEHCCHTILQPGALLRIKGAKQMGKTSLISQVLHYATQHGYHIALIRFQDIKGAIVQTLDEFLQWFCLQVSQLLQLPDKRAAYWDDLFGCAISCKSYFEEYLLMQCPQPIVLALDDVDALFPYSELADEFFGLLRAWHENAKNRDTWKKLRLVVAHASEVYIPLNIHKSPFNVGVSIELERFAPQHIQALANRYELTISEPELEALMVLIGGHPYLVQMTLYALKQNQLSLAQFLQPNSIAPDIYHNHLHQQWQALEHDAELATLFSQVIHATTPVELARTQAFKLQSLGLVTLDGAQVTPSCQLYVQYFRDRFSHSRFNV